MERSLELDSEDMNLRALKKAWMSYLNSQSPNFLIHKNKAKKSDNQLTLDYWWQWNNPVYPKLWSSSKYITMSYHIYHNLKWTLLFKWTHYLIIYFIIRNNICEISFPLIIIFSQIGFKITIKNLCVPLKIIFYTSCSSCFHTLGTVRYLWGSFIGCKCCQIQGAIINFV